MADILVANWKIEIGDVTMSDFPTYKNGEHPITATAKLGKHCTIVAMFLN